MTFATGMAATMAAEKVVDQLKQRAAMIWDITPDAVDWRDGAGVSRPAPTPARSSRCRSAEIALKAARTGGPVTSEVSVNAQGAGPGFGAHICDVEVDKETGQVTIVRYTAVQDVGRAIHPSYVEGQIQGGAAQGIGWALNEEYIYDKNGQMDNPGFLDYRCPVASDLPMIEAILVEVPNPRHPFGARGVGEVPIIPPMAAVGNAIRDAIGLRMTEPADVAAEGPHGAGRGERRRLMPKVVISGTSCQRFTGGKTELEVAATTFRRLVLELEQRFPGLGKQVEEGMAVAIDGEIFQDAYSAELQPDSEIVADPEDRRRLRWECVRSGNDRPGDPALRLGQYAGGRLGRHRRGAERRVRRLRHAALDRRRHPRARPRLAARQLPGHVRRRLGARPRHLLRHAGGTHLHHVAPMPGAAEALAAGAAWPQGVVSNKAGRFLRAEVTHLGWAGHFGAVVGAGDASADKPDPRRSCWRSIGWAGRPIARSGISATPRSTWRRRAPRGSPPCWSATPRTMVGLTGRVPISISLPRPTLPHACVRLA